MNKAFWTNKLARYSTDEWSQKANIFAELTLPYLLPGGDLLDLCAGLGQDSKYFAAQGQRVIAADLVTKQLGGIPDIVVKEVDLKEPLPFGDNSFDTVYSHLGLHYFTDAETKQLFAEIHRVLRPKGIVAFLVNSTKDPEHGTGKMLEAHLFDIDGVHKRFFDREDALTYAHGFTPLLCNEQGETHKDRAKGVHNLVQFIGRKKQ